MKFTVKQSAFWLLLIGALLIWPWSGWSVAGSQSGQRLSWQPAKSCAAVTNPNCPGEATSPVDPETSPTLSPTSTASVGPSPTVSPTVTPTATLLSSPTPLPSGSIPPLISPTPTNPPVYDPPFEYCDFFPLDIFCGGPGESPAPSPELSPEPSVSVSPASSPELSPTATELVSPTSSDIFDYAYCDLFPADPLCQTPTATPTPDGIEPLPTPTLDPGPIETVPIEQSASLEAFIIYCQAINYSDPLCPAAPAN